MLVWQLTKSISEKRETIVLKLVSFMRRLADRRGSENVFSPDGEPGTLLLRDYGGKIGFIILWQIRKGTWQGRLVGSWRRGTSILNG